MVNKFHCTKNTHILCTDKNMIKRNTAKSQKYLRIFVLLLLSRELDMKMICCVFFTAAKELSQAGTYPP